MMSFGINSLRRGRQGSRRTLLAPWPSVVTSGGWWLAGGLASPTMIGRSMAAMQATTEGQGAPLATPPSRPVLETAEVGSVRS